MVVSVWAAQGHVFMYVAVTGQRIDPKPHYAWVEKKRPSVKMTDR